MTTTIEKSIEVEVPVDTAYDQWTQFLRGWDARITEQKPVMRVAWRSEGGAENAGVATFLRVDEGHTKVMLQLEFDPRNIVAEGDKLGFVSRRAANDLKHFKEYVDARGREAG